MFKIKEKFLFSFTLWWIFTFVAVEKKRKVGISYKQWMYARESSVIMFSNSHVALHEKQPP